MIKVKTQNTKSVHVTPWSTWDYCFGIDPNDILGIPKEISFKF